MHFISRKFFLFLLILVGSVSWSLTMVKSGLVYSYGAGFWGPNGHDGVWHIALINRLARGSLEMPIFAGETIKNYHLAYDAFLALVYKVTGIPAHILYFQIFPPILAVLIGWLTYRFVLGWRKSETQAFWAVFFVYFGGSWGWIVTLVRDKDIGGESMFWSQQAISTLINPPYALSLIFILLGLLLFKKLNEKFSVLHFLFAILIFGVLIQIKAYAGILVLAGLLIVSIWHSFRFISDVTRNTSSKVRIWAVFFGSLLVALLLFFPTNRNAGSLLVFNPFWFPETMVSFPDRFYWPTLASAISSYKSGGNFIKLIPAEILALAIFWFGNLGTRVLKELLVLRWIGSWKKLDSIQVFILTIIISGIVLPLLFIQKGNPWNTIQFLYYSLFFSGILAGIFLGEIIERKKWGMAIGALVLLLSIPSAWSTLRHYLPGRPPSAIPAYELKALEFLKEQTDGIVLTYPFNSELRKNWQPPQPLWVYETTSYIAAFSEKNVFLEDEMNLEITGYNWRPRREASDSFFKTQDQDYAMNFLKTNEIRYIYLVSNQNLPAGDLDVEKIYDQGNIRIYRVL